MSILLWKANQPTLISSPGDSRFLIFQDEHRSSTCEYGYEEWICINKFMLVPGTWYVRIICNAACCSHASERSWSTRPTPYLEEISGSGHMCRSYMSYGLSSWKLAPTQTPDRVVPDQSTACSRAQARAEAMIP